MALVCFLALRSEASAQEWTVTRIHEALERGETTCVELVRAHLERIEAYDDRGPTLNAILTVNPAALDEAAALDRARAAGAPMGPLHCVPVVLKDNYGTRDLPTTGASKALADVVPPDDAFVVARFREAQAIIVAKANLMELAMGGTTVSSLGGQTRNPYDLTRTPGGSSGGTGAAIAAGFGVIGTGSDTGQSTRSPASANALVGIRATRGLVSRAGVIPNGATQDEIGPITRTVEDAARTLDVMAGYDPADPVTAYSRGRIPDSYVEALDAGALEGARIGLLLDFVGGEPVHEPVNAVLEQAVRAMEAAGATIVRFRIPGIEDLTADLALSSFEFRDGFERWLRDLGERAPVSTLAEFVATGAFDPAIRSSLEAGLASEGTDSDGYRRRWARREALRLAVAGALAEHDLDAILYPHQKRLVVPIGEPQLERNGVLSNGTGFPAVTFPAGFSAPTGTAPLGVPVGIELLGPEWSEPTLLGLAFAFTERVHARRPPASTP